MKEGEKAIFSAKNYNYTVTGPNGKIQFQNGQYNTADQAEIDFLDNLAANPIPGRKIDKVQALKTESEAKSWDKEKKEDPADWDKRVEQYEVGGGWYKIEGENYHGKDEAIAELKRLEG